MSIFINVSKVPEFQKICTDLAQDFNGKPLSMHLFEKIGDRSTGLDIYVQQLLPVQVVEKIDFLLNQVPQASYTLYLKWFLDSIGVEFGSESESILVDVIRYIIVNVHPPNEIIFGSEIFQRYMMLGNLIQQ